MDARKLRQVELFTLIEEKIIDCFEERCRISQSLSQIDLPNHRAQYQHRVNEIDSEIRILWWKYRLLVGVAKVQLS